MPTTTATDNRQAIPTTPPANWQREIPKYRVTRETNPAPKARFRTEPPFSSFSENDCWQYGERTLKVGEIIETTEWPHPMFWPLNYSAKRVLDFLNSRQKSRLPRSPWADDQVRLEDGLGGPQPQIKAPKPEPVRMASGQAWPDM
jgi:hypothetical protein